MKLDQSLKDAINLAQIRYQKYLMVTGDNLAAAKVIANKLGITDIYAAALPSENYW